MIKKLAITVIGCMFLFSATAYAKVEKKELKIKMTEAQFNEKGKNAKGAKYNKAKGEMTFEANQASGKFYRLVHDGTNVITVVEGSADTVTTTCYDIIECVDEAAVQTKIKELGLKEKME